jgi:hypothetical protein
MLTTAGITEVKDLIFGLSSPTGFTYAAFGTGTGAESSGDTTLGTEIDRAIAVTNIISKLAPSDTVQYVGTFTVTTARVVAEIGTFNDASAGDMLGRELLSTTVSASENSTLVTVYEFTVKES